MLATRGSTSTGLPCKVVMLTLFLVSTAISPSSRMIILLVSGSSAGMSLPQRFSP